MLARLSRVALGCALVVLAGGCAHAEATEAREAIGALPPAALDPLVHVPEDTVGLVRIDVDGLMAAPPLQRLAGLIRRIGEDQGLAKVEERLAGLRTGDEVILPLTATAMARADDDDDEPALEGAPPLSEAAARDAEQRAQQEEERESAARRKEVVLLVATTSAPGDFLRVAGDDPAAEAILPSREIAGREVFVGSTLAVARLDAEWLLLAHPDRIDELLRRTTPPAVAATPRWARARFTADLEGAQLSFFAVDRPGRYELFDLETVGVELHGMAGAIQIGDALGLRCRVMTSSPTMAAEGARRIQVSIDAVLKMDGLQPLIQQVGAAPTFRATSDEGDIELALVIPGELVDAGLDWVEQMLALRSTSPEEWGEGGAAAPNTAPCAPSAAMLSPWT